MVISCSHADYTREEVTGRHIPLCGVFHLAAPHVVHSRRRNLHALLGHGYGVQAPGLAALSEEMDGLER
jgi:hypothetical protein